MYLSDIRQLPNGMGAAAYARQVALDSRDPLASTLLHVSRQCATNALAGGPELNDVHVHAAVQQFREAVVNSRETQAAARADPRDTPAISTVLIQSETVHATMMYNELQGEFGAELVSSNGAYSLGSAELNIDVQYSPDTNQVLGMNFNTRNVSNLSHGTLRVESPTVQ
jgi:hypothetical protein